MPRGTSQKVSRRKVEVDIKVIEKEKMSSPDMDMGDLF